MSDAPTQPRTELPYEDSIRLLDDHAKEKGDEWRVKVLRRASSAGQLESVATFDAVTVEQLCTPETWLPILSGGGPYYVLQVYHASALSTLAAILCPPVIPGSPRPADPTVTFRSDWRGPKVLLSPTPQKPATPPQAPPTSAPGPVNGTASANVDPRDDGAGRRFAEQYAALAEQRIAIQLDAVKAAAETDRKRLETRLADVLDAVRSAPRTGAEQKSMGEQLAPLLAAVAPILAGIMQAREAADARREALEARREEREAREREAREKREAMIADRISAQSSETSKVLAAMSDVVANSMRNSLQFMATVQELQAPAEDTWAAVAKEIPGAIAAFAAARANAPPAAPALPASPAAAPVATTAPAAAPAASAAPQGPAAPSGDGEEEESEELTVDNATAEQVLGELVRMIKADTAPKDVALLYVEAAKRTKGFAAEIQKGGGILAVFRAALTDAWLVAPANTDRVKAILSELDAQVQSERKKQAAA